MFKYEGNEVVGVCFDDEVEVIVWFWDFVMLRGVIFYFDEGLVYEFLDDDYCGIVMNIVVICIKFISFMLGRLGCDEDGYI